MYIFPIETKALKITVENIKIKQVLKKSIVDSKDKP